MFELVEVADELVIQVSEMGSKTRLHRNGNCHITIHVNIVTPRLERVLPVEISRGVSSFWYRQMMLSHKQSSFSLFTLY
jgi:hypothetical protein